MSGSTDGIPKLGSRDLFPTLASRAYLNHAAASPLWLPVTPAARRFTDDFARDPSGVFFERYHQRDGLRKKLASLIGASLSFSKAAFRETSRPGSARPSFSISRS